MQHLPWGEFKIGSFCVWGRCLCIYHSATELERSEPDFSWSAEQAAMGTTVAMTCVILLQGLRVKPDLSIRLKEDVNLQRNQ